MQEEPIITVKAARRILGTTAKGLSDDAIMHLLRQTESIADTVIAHFSDSKIKSGVEKKQKSANTKGQK